MTTPELSLYREKRIERRRERRIRKLEKQLVNIIFRQTFDPPDTDKITNWAEEALVTFNSLSKQTVGEKRNVKKLLRETAGQLVQSPQDISTAAFVWKSHDSFYQLIKDESKTIIREKWESITPEQLAELVRIYADNPQAQDFAKEMLTSYFDRPKTRRQRINAYYTFVSSVVDLVGEDTAFTFGVKIGLCDTDILPKDPNLIEQTLLLSLPYNEEEIVFQKLLIARNIVFQLSFLSLEDLGAVRQKHYDFLSTNDKLKKRWSEELGKAVKQIGKARVSEINKATVAFDMRREDVLSEKEKLELENIWPFNLFFDKSDPLNQKFQKVLSERGALPI